MRTSSAWLILTLNNQLYIQKPKDAQQRSNFVSSGKFHWSHVGSSQKERERAKEKVTASSLLKEKAICMLAGCEGDISS